MPRKESDNPKDARFILAHHTGVTSKVTNLQATTPTRGAAAREAMYNFLPRGVHRFRQSQISPRLWERVLYKPQSFGIETTTAIFSRQIVLAANVLR